VLFRRWFCQDLLPPVRWVHCRRWFCCTCSRLVQRGCGDPKMVAKDKALCSTPTLLKSTRSPQRDALDGSHVHWTAYPLMALRSRLRSGCHGAEPHWLRARRSLAAELRACWFLSLCLILLLVAKFFSPINHNCVISASLWLGNKKLSFQL